MTTINNLTNGIFQVNTSGKVSIDYLDDGGRYKKTVAIFSLQSMENLEIGSQEFVQEAANRALSNSELGYVVIQDDGDLHKPSFPMQEGDRFAIMVTRNGTIVDIATNPSVENALFSFDTLGIKPDSCETATYTVNSTEQILISDIFSDFTLVKFNSNLNRNFPYQILVRT